MIIFSGAWPTVHTLVYFTDHISPFIQIYRRTNLCVVRGDNLSILTAEFDNKKYFCHGNFWWKNS